MLLGAFDRLVARGGSPRATDHRPVLWIAGDGPLTESLRRRYPESDDRRWLGVLSEEEKTRRLVAADVVCAPSLEGESFGMVLLEAMAARAVVVASDIDGYREAAGGRAVLVAPGEADAWAGALGEVLAGTSARVGADGEGRRRWLESAEARAELWSMERLAERYEALYASVVAGSAE